MRSCAADAGSITPNSNTLPVALIQSLVTTVPQLHWVRDGEDTDTPDLMLGRALTYLVMYSTLGTVQRWSIGASLLASVTNDQKPPTWRRGSGMADDVTDNFISSQRREQLASGSLFSGNFVSEPVDESALAESHIHVPESRLVWFWRHVCVPGWNGFLAFMTVPLWAALLSFIVAMLAPLQRALVACGPVVGALDQAGQCSIPLSILVLGAYFHAEEEAPTPERTPARNPAEETEPSDIVRQRSGPDYSWRTILAATIARMIITPLITVPALWFACIWARSDVYVPAA